MDFNKLAKDLTENDVIDLKEIFTWMDSEGCGEEISDMDRLSAEYELAVVESVEMETPQCVVIYNDTLNVAVPPDMEILVYV